MKKIFTLMTLLFTVVGAANAQKDLSLAAGWNTAIEDVTLTGEVEFNYKNSYAAVNLISEPITIGEGEGEYASYALEFEADAESNSFQFNISYDAGEGYKEGYSGGLSSYKPGALIPEGTKTIKKIALQACNKENLGRVVIKSFYLIDKKGNKVATNYEVPPSWAADVVTPITKGTMSFTAGGQWNFGSLKGCADIELPVTITVNADALPDGVQLNIWTDEPAGEDVRHEYRGWGAGSPKTFSVDIEPNEDGATIQGIDIQNAVAQDPFKIKNLTATITPFRWVRVGDAGYSTFSSTKPVSVDGIVTAYAAKYNGTSVTLTEVTEVPANTGVIIEASKGDYKAPVIESATAINENDLLVSDGSVVGNGNIYVLANGDEGVGFYKLKVGDKVPAGKAYLVITATSRDFFSLNGDDETTGISEVGKTEDAKDNVYYNIAGQRVAQPKNGLYIVNGKKVILK